MRSVGINAEFSYRVFFPLPWSNAINRISMSVFRRGTGLLSPVPRTIYVSYVLFSDFSLFPDLLDVLGLVLQCPVTFTPSLRT